MFPNPIGHQVSGNHYNQLSQANQLFPEKGHYPLADSSNGISKKQEAFIAGRGEDFKRYLHDMTPKMQVAYMAQNFPDSSFNSNAPNAHLTAAQNTFVAARGPAFQKWFNDMKPEEQKSYLTQNFADTSPNKASTNNSASVNFSDVLQFTGRAAKTILNTLSSLGNSIGTFFSGLFGINKA